ncbi:MAG: PEP-CTERM sorting domain-containing protein, partial [Planctomycetales bacterium]|nr:PEP-CTERM sorting domain-containing protein [Planctomycetales bacterium]
MKRLTGLVLLTTALAAYAKPTLGASVSLSDATPANFTATPHDFENVVQNVPNDPSVDGYLSATWETGTNYGIGISWINSALAFDPVQMNDPVAFAVTWNMTGTDGDTYQNYFPVLEQGGTLYRRVGNFQVDSNGTGPHSQFLPGAQSWGAIIPGNIPDFASGSEAIDTASNPDFSSLGAPLRFGLHQWGGSTGGQILPAEQATTHLQDLTVDVEWFETLADLPSGAVARYDADADLIAPSPATQGWIEEFAGAQGSDVSPDAGYGKNAWSVTDATEENGQFTNYRVPMDFAQHTAAAEKGWELDWNVRFVDDFGDSISIRTSYGTGSSRWLVWLDLDSDGNLVVIPNNGGTLAAGVQTNIDGNALVTFNGDGTSAYHDLSLRYNPLSGNQALWVDGTLFFEDLGAQATGENGVAFGSGSSGGQGAANFNSVEFRIVPEPATAGGLVFLATIVGCLRRRK